MTVTVTPPFSSPDPDSPDSPDSPDTSESLEGSPDSARAGRAARTDEIVELLRHAHDNGDDSEQDRLRDELIAVNMPVARAIAGGYRNRGIASEDLEQIAYLALTKAARRFDVTTGHAFLSYCVPTVRGEVRRYFRDHGWMVRPPRPIQELQQHITRATSELTLQLGRPPAAREVAEHLDEDLEKVLEAMDGQGCFFPSSLDRRVGEGDTTLGDLLSSTETNTSAAEARLLLAPAVRRLGDRDKQIIQLRFFEGLTQREVGDHLGITQMQVSRLLTRVFRDLRTAVGPLDDHAAGRA